MLGQPMNIRITQYNQSGYSEVINMGKLKIFLKQNLDNIVYIVTNRRGLSLALMR